VLLGATSPIVVNDGWLYDILRWAGVSQATAAHWQEVVVKPLTVLLVLLVAVLISWLGSRIIRRWIGAAAHRAVSHADSPRAAARALTLTSLLANMWRGVVVVISIFVVLGTIGINLTPLLAGATVIGATLGFGAQSMVRDLLAGFLLTVEGQFDIGDTIVVGDTTGKVEDLTLRVTRLRSDDGVVWYVPNGEIRKLANSSRGWAQATVDVPVPVTAGVDTVLDAIRDAAAAVSTDPRYASLCLEPPRLWGVVAAAADTFTCRVSVRTSTPEREHVARILRQEIALRLQAAGVFAVPAPVAGPPASPPPGASSGREPI
jgi:small-conductance mechanosensitive channel